MDKPNTSRLGTKIRPEPAVPSHAVMKGLVRELRSMKKS